MSLNLLYLITKIIAVAASAAMSYDAGNDGDTVITVLVFLCIFLFGYFLAQIKTPPAVRAAINIIGIAVYTAIAFPSVPYFAVILVMAFEVIELFAHDRIYWYFIASLGLLLTLILVPQLYIIIMSEIVAVSFSVSRIILLRLENGRETINKQRDKIAELERKIGNISTYSRAVRESAALEERNRFAVRIHDQIGHSISGSIILLEAAKLNVRTNPDKSEECISLAAENLRSGVDNIRAALRQERPENSAIGLSAIKSALEEYKIKYDIQTEFETSGDTSLITYAVFACIKENLTEALTNTLKHSNADRFSVTLSVHDKMIRLEMRDNGRSAAEFKKGMGLTSIEERTLAANGKCLFSKRSDGFYIITIFRI